MKRSMTACLVVVVVAVVLGLSVAQTPTGTPSDDVYIVQKGDVLYTLEGNYSGKPNQWRRLVELNPILKNPGRIWVDGKGRTIALIRPGEKLRGLGELGIVPQPYPIDRLKVEAPAPIAQPPVPKTDHAWMWWLLLLIPLFAAIWMVLSRMRRDPVAAGPAVVAGGVTDQTAANQFRENISRTTGGSTDRIEIRDLVRGRIYGAVSVRYRDGSSRRMLLAGQTGYRAMVRRNGGPWTEEYMLQGCGNDLRFSGARYVPGMGFRFVPEAAVEEAPRPTPVDQPDPAPAPVPIPDPAPVPDPVPAPVPTSAAEGEKFFTFKPSGKGKPNFVEFEGFTSFEVDVKDGRTQVRFS